MDLPESSRSRARRDHEDGTRGGEGDEDWDGGSDRRKHRPGKSGKHGDGEEAEDQREVAKRKDSGDRSDGRRRSGGRANSGEDDDYNARRDSRSKVPKKGSDDRTHRDMEPESSSRKGRTDESERISLKKTSLKTSGHDGDSRSRNRVERDADYDKDSKYLERKDGSREKGHDSREQEKNPPRRRWDDGDPGSTRKTEESGYGERSESRSAKASDYGKHSSSRDRLGDAKNEPSESTYRVVDLSAEKGARSAGREEKRADGDKSKTRATQDEGARQVNASHENRLEGFRDDKQRRDHERPAEDMDAGGRAGSRLHAEKGDRHKQQREPGYGGHDDVGIRERTSKPDEDGHGRMRDRTGREVRPSRSRTPERRYHRESDELDRGYSESDNERGTILKGKEREKNAYRDDRPSKGKEGSWNDRNREREVSKDHWKRCHPSRQDREHREGDADYEYDRERDSKKRDQEWVDNEKQHGHPGYRKDNRTRPDGTRLSSSFGNANEHSDTIEIRPNKNLDFGRDESVHAYSGRRPEVGFQQDVPSGGIDEEWGYQADGRGKVAYGHDDGFLERYPDDGLSMDQSSRRNSSDACGGKGSGQKVIMNSSSGGASQISNSGSQQLYGSNQGSGSNNRPSQQNAKWNRHTRGGRGRLSGRDAQRLGLHFPMMGPPFGHLGMPPGPLQPLGPNMSPSPGPPIGPNVFIPPFPGHLIWPGPRGIDMNMLAVPPALSPIPPGPIGPRFAPNMAAGPNHGMYLNQPTPGRGASPNIPGPGFNQGGSIGRGAPHDKTPSGWAPPRSSGPAGKAPSRGEQNDYSQNFVDTGMRPQNFIRELELTSTVEDYPKLRELIQKKDEIVAKSASPPMYYKCDLKEFALSPEFFGTKFDVVLVDPPWEEYVHRAPGVADHMEYWTFEEILNLKIEQIVDTPSFIFLWVGDGVGLEQGRLCLKKWGFRRCEDICWVKTNKTNAAPSLRHDSHTLFQHSKEHCLMGIKGTVRRSTDGHIIHANIDTDIVIAEEPPYGSTTKPEDIYRIIEHFSLGRRRLELFGEDHNIRSGWLTVGKGLSSSNFNAEAYCRNFADKDGKVWQGGGGRNPPPEAPHLVVTTPDIESLRPKSPPAKSQQPQSTTISTGNSGKRQAGSSPQNTPAPSAIAMNQEVSSSNLPVPWGSSLVGSYKSLEVGNAGPDDKFFDGYGFNLSSHGQGSTDHLEFEPHQALNLM